MSTLVATAAPRISRTRSAWYMLPLVALVAFGLLAETGLRFNPSAHAATGTVVVNATVGSVVTLNTACGPIAIAVNLGSIASGQCNVSFGASNNSALPMTMFDNAGAAQFMSPANFAETATSCAALSVAADTVGYKIDSAALTATNSTGCAASATATNSGYSPFPNAATTVCTTNALGNQICPLAVMVTEAGSNAVAQTYSGTMNLAA